MSEVQDAATGRFINTARFHSNESILNQDVVVWYTFGLTHITRPEDYPVMPSARVGFKLMPKGFFVRNPALDVVPAP